MKREFNFCLMGPACSNPLHAMKKQTSQTGIYQNRLILHRPKCLTTQDQQLFIGPFLI